MTHTFLSEGIRLAYSDDGEGEPILLIHGFASNKEVNWRFTGWIDTLCKAGRRVLAIDNRGHGESEKVYDPALYSAPIMAEDARRLLDHLQIPSAAVMGYSMGARISAFLAMTHPGRVQRVVFGGLGMGMIEGVGDPEPIAAALEAPSLAHVVGERGRMFRTFAEQTKSDRLALAACMRSSRQRITAEEVARIEQPVLVAVGEKDDVGGSPDGLAKLMRQATALVIPRRDHMTAVGDKVFKEAVLGFLGAAG